MKSTYSFLLLCLLSLSLFAMPGCGSGSQSAVEVPETTGPMPTSGPTRMGGGGSQMQSVGPPIEAR